MAQVQSSYYVPHGSYWSIVASVGLVVMLAGFAEWLHYRWYAPYLFFTGVAIMTVTVFGWFGVVIKESQARLYDDQVEQTFRWAMAWFIFSEVFFFGAFFGALFYTRFWSAPLLGGDYYPITHILLWPDFSHVWPLLFNPDNTAYFGPDEVMHAWGIPAINTLLLLISGVTLTWAHWALKYDKRKQLVAGLLLTIVLGLLFLSVQAYEYYEAYVHMGLTLESGSYGATFFMLTGFHGLHVTIGAIMLMVILIRCMMGHFTPKHHFAFEAAAWYWHFVDVVWLFLFVFVYWL